MGHSLHWQVCIAASIDVLMLTVAHWLQLLPLQRVAACKHDLACSFGQYSLRLMSGKTRQIRS